MNKLPFIMIIVAGLFSCNNNHSSCPVLTDTFTTDSFIDTDQCLKTPVLSKEHRASIINLSKNCKPGFVYEAEMSCHLIFDTTYLLGFIRNTESQMCCEITNLHLLGKIKNSNLAVCTKEFDGDKVSNGYYVLFPEGVGCSYPWAAYVSDSIDYAMKQAYDSTLYAKGIPIFCYDKSWHPARVSQCHHY